MRFCICPIVKERGENDAFTFYQTLFAVFAYLSYYSFFLFVCLSSQSRYCVRCLPLSVTSEGAIVTDRSTSIIFMIHVHMAENGCSFCVVTICLYAVIRSHADGNRPLWGFRTGRRVRMVIYTCLPEWIWCIASAITLIIYVNWGAYTTWSVRMMKEMEKNMQSYLYFGTRCGCDQEGGVGTSMVSFLTAKKNPMLWLT